ncbi:uncharacterized protein GGS22DRAFT_196211 [Annulohypoxylon maeteangense]|uniref:uncharacterized protein n=1 Tax=Annulohypoxylon maeteangense TaxID=1927788 RepID=UPI0020075920|nr:uncharacterized protein GGS22DRAFT_196211 [Annulohypoxylon maeteangense]KAI0882054.1 hypothetical protein GGS22DRAFT_196211 [Annulohypoxylon maeteangense]
MSNKSSTARRPALQDASKRVNQTPIPAPTIPYLMKCASQPVAPAVTTVIPATAPKTTNNKKRKSDTTLEDEIAAYKQHMDLDYSTIDLEINMTCNQVRGKINKLVDNGIMNKTEFARTIGCTASSLSTFLSKRGSMEGQNSNVYVNAWEWFKQRDVAGLKMPNAKKARKAKEATAAKTDIGGPGTRKAAAPPVSAVDISGVQLPGEESDEVAVYDTCDEVRRKVEEHLDTPGITAAQFCRDIYAQLSQPTIKPFQSKQLNDFRNKQGSNAGCMSKVFYAAYVYFEKKRIAAGEPKSDHRVNMERIWGEKGGFDLEHDDRCGVWVGPGETFFIDQYGQLHFNNSRDVFI